MEKKLRADRDGQNAVPQGQVNAGEQGKRELSLSESASLQATADRQQAGYNPAGTAPIGRGALSREQIDYLNSLWEKAQQPMSLRADALQANKDRDEFLHAFLNSWPFIKDALRAEPEAALLPPASM